MADIRSTFLATVADLRVLIAAPEIGEHWEEASALERMTVAALTGHLLRGAATVEIYLDGDPPEGEAGLSPAEYYAIALRDRDLDSDIHRGVRERGAEMAAGGQAAV